MTRDDVIRLAREARAPVNVSMDPNSPPSWWACGHNDVWERFADLVAAHVLARASLQPIAVKTADLDPELLRDILAKAPAMPLVPMPDPAPEAIAAAVAAEREACAQVCEGMHEEDRPGDYAYAIRARGSV